MIFSKIKGHEDILSIFNKNISDHTFSGVYLFSGPKASGKHTIARQLGRYLTCTGIVDDACRCENCRLFPHVPDYIEISNENGDLKVADSQRLIDFFSLVPYRSKYRVAIINDADHLNYAASNELLKLTEEIKENSVIFMISSRPDLMLPTLASRAYHISFGKLSIDHTIEILKDIGHHTSKFEDIRRMLPFMSASIFNHFKTYLKYIKYIPDFLKKFPKMEEDDMLSEIKMINDQDELLFFLETLVIAFNDFIKLKYDSPDRVSYVSIIDTMEEIKEYWHEDICIFANEKLKNVHNQYTNNLNLKLYPLIIPAMCWIYHIMQKELKKKELTGKR